MEQYRYLTKKYSFKFIFEIDNIFKELGDKKARIILEKGHIVKVQPHLNNVIQLSPNLSRDYKDIGKYDTTDYTIRFTDHMSIVACEVHRTKDKRRIIKLDTWLLKQNLLILAAPNKWGRMEGKVTVLNTGD